MQVSWRFRFLLLLPEVFSLVLPLRIFEVIVAASGIFEHMAASISRIISSGAVAIAARTGTTLIFGGHM